jgi:hypothetical protein
MVQFARVQDVADFLRITINPADTGVLRALTEASAVIQNYTHQTLELVANDVITLDIGPDQRKIFLPELPVVSVASVVEDGEALVAGNDEDYQLGADGILHRRSGRGFWTPGIQIIVVTYTHGYPLDYDFDGWPDDIRGVCTRMAARALQAGLRAAETAAVPGVSGTTIGDYQVSYSAESAGGGGGTLFGASAAPSLLRSEERILDRYKYKRQVPG